MNIHKLHSYIFKIGGWREKRLQLFNEEIKPTNKDILLERAKYFNVQKSFNDFMEIIN